MSEIDATAVAQAVQAEIARQSEAAFAAMSADELSVAVAKLEEQLAKAKAALAEIEAPVAVAQKAADSSSLPDLPWGCTRSSLDWHAYARAPWVSRALELLASIHVAG